MVGSRLILRLFWYGVSFYVVLSYMQVTFANKLTPHTFAEWLTLGKAALGLFLIVAFFILVGNALRSGFAQTALQTNAPPSPAVGQFPSPTTVSVGRWLLVLTAALAFGLFFILNSFCWPDWIKKCLETAPDLTNVLATMLGAGVGSAIATILAYLEHASEKKDFDLAYVPWYIGRPLMGMLLGLVFYLLLRDGLLAVISNKSQPEDLSIAGLAGVGALVGLFSKQAIEKLRELFNTLFSTKKSVEEAVLERLPPDLRRQVAEFMINPKNR